MPKYNKGTKRLITLIKNEKEKLKEELVERTVDAVNIRRTNNINQVLENGIVNFDLDSVSLKSEVIFANNALEKYNNVINFIEFMNVILMSLEEQEMFISFSELDFLFTYLNFPEEFQMDVLAYILKNNVRSANNTYEVFQKLGNKANYYPLIEDNINILSEMFGNRINLEEVKKRANSEDYIKHIKLIVDNYNIINEYISDNYEFVGTEDINRLYDAIKAIDLLLLTKKQIEKIIWYVSEKQNEKIKEANKPTVTPTVKKEVNIKPVSIDFNKLRKEQNIIKQQLKLYLYDEKPIKYMTNDELICLMQLLTQAGYSEEKIAKIKKNVIENNIKIEQEETERKLLVIKQKYLSVEEIEVLENIEEKLKDQDSCINPLFINIKENYEFVNEELLKLSLSQKEDLDSIELIKVAILEMQETMTNYIYSDYRITLDLKK